MTLTVATNASGSAATVEHFIPLLSKADNPRVIFMSSGAGSLKLAHDFGFVKEYPAYCMSKAAENMAMLYFHHKYPDWKVNASNPGFRVSN
jgi:NAD(P)-dependent dehydrogenase (short-subunit alcohol dehydrogenase family)